MNAEKEMGESVKGSYSYHDDDGKEYKIEYTADENGFRPVRMASLLFYSTNLLLICCFFSQI